ncbi:pilus assembly protein TadG-related protein [Cupriavidus sp. UYPR2.512]|uniref:pilus assembly protein TadG-related protein n=1 Tax=Cupriavidus sp. UYPR2.512 TaxID=1080187 RepID=UPI000376AC7A|nr:pilus assembly protein TadG-related protein [Cupriavidus sp. UYPR2.512]UIF87020.1 hypothetical protein KAF44_05335 [Cupriavidus necator]
MGKTGLAQRRSRPGQRGQALAFALVFLVIGGLALYLAFNASQLTSAKTKLQNTADAAAYSAAVLQARDYNFAAYANRAMVANQVAVAQAVSLKSWIDELKGTYTDNTWIDTLVKIFSDGQLLWTTPKQLGKAAITPVRSALNTLLPPLVTGLDDIIAALSMAQRAYHAGTIAAVPLVTDEVAKRNQPDSTVSSGYFFGPRYGVQLARWTKFTTVTDPQNPKQGSATGKDRFADVTTDGATLDGFLKDRGSPRSPTAVPTAYKGCKGAVVAIMVTVVTHDGGTQLRRDKKGWEALDASQANGTLACVWATPAGPVGFAIPTVSSVGRGGAANGPGGRYSGRTGYGGYSNFGGSLLNPLTLIAAQMQYSSGPGKTLHNRPAGLQEYADLSNQPKPGTGPADDFNRAPSITIEAQRQDTSVVTSSRVLPGGDRLTLDERMAGGMMRALASGSAYFIRPTDSGGMAGALRSAAGWRRADSRVEYPSLFNPYWQASLTQTSDLERVAAIAAQGN